ncbi:tetratricopeptide repeat protein [Chryseolinea sp. T2]|uniref:tetratricopeptide repeat protein n=1 Tax=Chryseolinea sp. T2 TaxID=3129255 RepID=UPI0030773ED8
MKLAAIVILTVAAIVDPVTIGKINSLKREAREAYVAGDYKTAISKYRILIDSLHANEDEIRLNLANAYFNASDTTQALSSYQSVMGSPKADIRSKAQQQLGVMNHRAGKLEEALDNFKQAIKADPNNRDARYNYEMLKKKLEEEKKKQEQQQNRDKQNKENQKDDQQKDQKQEDQKKNEEQKKKEQEQKDQQQKDQQKKEQEEKEKEKKEQEQKEDAEKKDQKDSEEKQEKNDKQPPPDWSKKLQDMKMTEEKARMILEAMKNQEKQYLQQNQRKATKPRDKGKPDW